MARGLDSTFCARAARDAAPRRVGTACLACPAPCLRRNSGTGCAGRDAFRSVPASAASIAAAREDRTVLRPVRRTLLWCGAAGPAAVGAQAVLRIAQAGETARTMSAGLDFTQPWVLVLLPLAVLPLLRRRRDTLMFSHLGWLPADRAGRIVGFLW